MKSIKLINIVVLSAFLSVLTIARCSAGTLEEAIEHELAPLNQFKCDYGIVVLRADTGEPVYQVNPDLPLAPASNQKLMTTIIALAAMGTDFEFTTTLARRGEDYFVIGDGDPGLGDPGLMKSITQVFDDWAMAIRKTGVTEIKGKLVFDDTIFDQELHHPHWPTNQLHKWYSAPVSGLNLNDNCLELSVGFDPERKAQLVVAPAADKFTVDPVWIQAKSSETIINPAWEASDRLKVRVTLGTQPAGPVFYTVRDPGRFFAAVLMDRFQAYGIKVRGAIEFRKVRNDDGSLPQDLVIVAQHKTPIFDAVTRSNKNSQNLFAECLFKRTGYQVALNSGQSRPGSWSTGELAAKAFLEQILKVPTTQLVIDDGSGLSRYNRQTSRTIAKLLTYVHERSWRDRFIQTLAVAGVKGTLSRRMRNTPAEGKIFAKTGYISNVSALSGYVLDGENQPRFIFSMLFNFHPTGKLWQVKAVEDKICMALAQSVEGRPTTNPTPEPETNDTEEDIQD